MNPAFAPLWTLVATVAMLVMFVLIALIVVQARTRREAQRIELQTRILDRMGSAREFGEFLSTDAGQRFLNSMTSHPSQPRDRVLDSVRVGIVLVVIGPALFMFGDQFPFGLGMLVLAAGVGMLVSAFVSYQLARRLGMLDRDAARRDRSGVPPLA